MKWHQMGSAIFLLLFGSLVCFEAQKLDVGKIVKPGPGFFPFWLSIALIITSLSLVLVIELKRQRVEESSSSETLWKELRWGKTFLTLVALLFYAFFLESLGFCITTAALMFFLFWIIGGQSWVVVVSGSLISSLLTYALFRLWLQVQLPVGLWGF